jgi:hypothetical protein
VVLRLFNYLTAICIVLVVLFLGAAFCASLIHTSGVELATVGGRVTFHGRPQENLCVEFVPVYGGRGGEGRSDREGRYKAIYSNDKEGVPVGPQKVIISTAEVYDTAQRVITPRKALLTTNIEVHSGVNELDFDVAEKSAN